MSWTTTIPLAAALWLLWVAFAAIVRRQGIRADDPEDLRVGLAMIVIRIYARLFHRLRVTGAGHIPKTREPGPLIVVSNHTAGIDPILIQSVCPFEVRWMMAEDMRAPQAEPVWKWLRIIFVDRLGRRTERSDGAIREAIRWARDGNVLGVFPEGFIERPPESVLPFQPGIALLAARSKARILPVIVRGTPRVNLAFQSLFIRGHCHLEFLSIIEPEDVKAMGRDVAQNLRSRYLQATGWPANEATPTLKDGVWLFPDGRHVPELRSD